MWWLLAALSLAGCQSPPQTQQLQSAPPDIARQHLIKQVPFYPQQEFFCGPTTLAEVAAFYGRPQDPSAIAPQTFTPGLQGSLQVEMAAAARQLGLLAYASQGSMSQLLQLVAANLPVIVLQNNGLSWYPRWHYAVVIGYDLDAGELELHTGLTANYRLDFATFERTWQRGQYWLLLMLPPEQAHSQLDPFLYSKASQDLFNTAQPAAGLRALQSATEQWPDYWLPYFLLANYHSKNDESGNSAANEQAAAWFAKGLHAGRRQIAYLNNYALLLKQQGCPQQAEQLIAAALKLAPTEPNLLDSQRQIKQTPAGQDMFRAQCPSLTALFPQQ